GVEELAPGGGARLGRGVGPGELPVGLERQRAGERREEDHGSALGLGAVAGQERSPRALLEARQGDGVSAHLGAERAVVEQPERHVVLLGLHRELHLLEVGGDRVVPGNVGADMMRGGGTDYCSECRDDYWREWREDGNERGGPGKD